MRDLASLAFLILLTSAVVLAEGPELTITALGNEGFVVAAGSEKVMFDGLYEGLSGYVSPTSSELQGRIDGRPPFDGIRLLVASHHHADHFHPGSVVRFLERNPEAELVTTRQALGAVAARPESSVGVVRRVHGVRPTETAPQALTAAGYELLAFAVHHGRQRRPVVENLGVLVEVGPFGVLHLGDAETGPEELMALGIAEYEVDVAFAPWYLLPTRERAEAVAEALGARLLVAMHVPASDAPARYFGSLAGRDAVFAHLRALWPERLRVLEIGESMTLEAETATEGR